MLTFGRARRALYCRSTRSLRQPPRRGFAENGAAAALREGLASQAHITADGNGIGCLQCRDKEVEGAVAIGIDPDVDIGATVGDLHPGGPLRLGADSQVVEQVLQIQHILIAHGIAIETADQVVSVQRSAVEEDVPSGPAGHGVVADVAEEEIIACAAIETIVAGAADQKIAIGATQKGIVAILAVQIVLAFIARDQIVLTVSAAIDIAGADGQRQILDVGGGNRR